MLYFDQVEGKEPLWLHVGTHWDYDERKRKEVVSKNTSLIGLQILQINWLQSLSWQCCCYLHYWGTQTAWRNKIDVWREDSQAEKTRTRNNAAVHRWLCAPLASTDLGCRDILILMYITFELCKSHWIIFFFSMNSVGCTLNPLKL